MTTSTAAADHRRPLPMTNSNQRSEMNWHTANATMNMFNDRASDPRNQADRILDSLGLAEGESVADIGSGGGYYVFRFSNIVGPGGRVFAVDTNTSFLKQIGRSAGERDLPHIILTCGTKDEPNLPEGELDVVFMRNSMHHIENPADYARRIRRSLKEGGRLVVIDYRRKRGWSFHGLFGHSIRKDLFIQEMEAAGFDLAEDHDFLPEQHFLVFSPKELDRR